MKAVFDSIQLNRVRLAMGVVFAAFSGTGEVAKAQPAPMNPAYGQYNGTGGGPAQSYIPPQSEYLPTPGNPRAGSTAPAVQQAPAIPQPPYAYPAAPGAPATTPAAKPAEAAAPKSATAATPSELEALRRENYLLNQRLAAAQPGGLKPQVQQEGTVPYIEHTVRHGDSLWGLAMRYRTRVSDIRNFNYMTKDKLVEGKVIRIPVPNKKHVLEPQQAYYTPPTPGGPTNYEQAPKTSPVAPKPAPAWGKHIVHPGETLSLIAQHYNVSTRAMQTANGLRSANRIIVGQELIVPGRTAAEVADLAKKPVPTAQPILGAYPPAAKPAARTDNAEGRFVSTPKRNALSPTTSPLPGTGAAPQPTGNRGITSHRVKTSDTLESVAKTYNLTPSELRSFNRLPDNKLPPAGNVILVPTPAIVSL